MALRLHDGYTLKGQTSGTGNTEGEVLPVVKFEYRPPLAREISQFRYDMTMAKNGDEQHDLRRAFVLARLVVWDVELSDGKRANVTADVIDQLPDPILLDIVAESMKWRPRPQEDAAGN